MEVYENQEKRENGPYLHSCYKFSQTLTSAALECDFNFMKRKENNFWSSHA